MGQKVREVPAWGHPRVAVLPVAVKVADFQEGLGAARVAGKAGHKVGKGAA